MAQEMTHVTATAATGLVALISIANGSGRLLWAWLSDFPGRRQVFLTMFPPPSGTTDTTRISPRQPQSAGRTL
jgi:MFS family permease